MSRDDRPQLRKCSSCSAYTLKPACPHCKGRAVSPAPAKFSPEDKYAAYRRKYKENQK